MADLTATFNTLLKEREAPLTRPPVNGTIDEFLTEAHRICTLVTRLHSELRNLRQAYLSTAGPRKAHLRTSSRNTNSQQPVSLTDRDREEIDANAKMTLRDLNARIRALEDAEQLRRNTEDALIQKRFARGLGGTLGAWASGMGGSGVSEKSREQAVAEAAARQFGEHRESIIWFLRQRLQAAVKTQQKMMETRLARELEKSRSIPAKVRGPIIVSSPGRDTNGFSGIRGSGSVVPSNGQPYPPAEEDQTRRPPPMEDLTPEQMQMFEKGNQDMLKNFESTLDKVRTAEKSLVEISELQNLLVGNLSTQSAHIDQLVAESFETTEGVGKGNQELKKSASRASPARYTFFAATGLCAILIIWDLLV